MDAELLSGLESGDLAVVAIVYILLREVFAILRNKKESVSSIQSELQPLTAAIDLLHTDLKSLTDMHLDSDSKFATVNLYGRLETLENRITDILQRIELKVK